MARVKATTPTRSKQATFIVRLWAEARPERESSWRGEVEHTQTGQKRYFRNFSQLCEIMREQTLSPNYSFGLRGGGRASNNF